MARRRGETSVAVAPGLADFFQRGEGFDLGEGAVGGDALLGIGDIIGGNPRGKQSVAGGGGIGGDEVEGDFDVGTSGFAFPLEFGHGGFEQAAIKLEADGEDVSALFGAEDVAGTADFEVAHGDTEAGTEARVLADGGDALAGSAGAHEVARQHEVSVSFVIGSSNAPAQLVEVGESEAIGAVDDDGVGVGDIETALDDGGAEENISAAGDERLHDVLEFLLGHLSVTDDDARFGDKFGESSKYELNGLHAVVEEIDLSAPGQFPADGIADETFVIAADDGFDGDAVGRRGFDGAHVAGAKQREVECAGNRRGREGEHIDAVKSFLETFLVQHAEALFFVDDDEAEVFESNVFAEQAVGTDDDVDAAVAQTGERLLLLLRRAEAAEQADGHRIVRHAFAQRLPMLVSEHGGGCEEGDLASAGDGFERGADGDLGFAEADVAADEAIHRLGRFHVVLGVGDGAELVGRFGEGERFFELALPRMIRGKRVAGFEFAFGLQAEKFLGVGEDGFFRFAPGALPTAVTEFAERGIFASDPDVAGNFPTLIEGNVKLRASGELERENFAGVLLSGQNLQTAKTGDAVVEVDDQVVLFEIVEAEGLPRHGGAGSLPAAAAGFEAGGAAEDFGIGEQGEAGVRQEEAAREMAKGDRQRGRVELIGGGEFAQAGGFALIGADEADGPTVLHPAGDLGEKVPSALFQQHDITGGEIAERMIGGEDFVATFVGKDGAGVQDGVGLGERVFDAEVEGVVGKIFPHGGTVGRRCGFAEGEFARIEGFHRALRIRIVGTQRVDFVTEKLEARGQRGLPGEDVHDAAAHGELSALGGGGDALESGTVELVGEIGEGEFFAAAQGEGFAIE